MFIISPSFSGFGTSLVIRPSAASSFTPQDHTYITKNFGFSSDIVKVETHLGGLYASGGGDGPEAVTAALAEALNMDWRPQASKMVVLIADAPPHGIGEYGDGASS